MSNKGKKYSTKITPKQEKFINLYTSKYGLLSARDCAIRAGYDPGSAHTRANELLDWRKNPHIVEEINARQIANREVWLIDKEKHLANLTRIQNEARAKGQYGVAGKMEELKGKVQGFYIDRNMTLTKEISEEDMSAKMKEMFPTIEEFEAINKSIAEEMFGPLKNAKDDKKEEE